MAMQSIKVWDPAVRIVHWSLVLFFTTSWLTGEAETDLHIYSGYALIGLVLFRLLWGFLGTPHARFADFVKPPRVVFAYAVSMLRGSPDHYEGHNPLGGWMIIALLSAVLLTGLSGLKLYGAEGHGPLASAEVTLVPMARADEDHGYREHEEAEEYEAQEHEENGAEEFWEEVHEFFASFTLLLVFVHIGGVLVASALHHENLVKAMLTGRKAGLE